MATLAQIRTKIDNQLALLWPKVVNRQTTYYANNGRYFQGLKTHTVVPAEGNDIAPDNLNSHPTDQIGSWVNAFATDVPAAIAFSLTIDAYKGPQGDGFVGIVTVSVLGKTYSRSQNYGPETWRTVAWRELMPLVGI